MGHLLFHCHNSLHSQRKGEQINKILKKSLLSYTEPVRTLTNIYDREIRIEFNNYWTRLRMMWRIMQIVESLSTEAEGRSDVERRIKVSEKRPFLSALCVFTICSANYVYVSYDFSTKSQRQHYYLIDSVPSSHILQHCLEFNLKL